MGLERSNGTLAEGVEEAEVSLEEEVREVCKFLILLAASCRVGGCSEPGSRVWDRVEVEIGVKPTTTATGETAVTDGVTSARVCWRGAERVALSHGRRQDFSY